jgi:hypothetical protein
MLPNKNANSKTLNLQSSTQLEHVFADIGMCERGDGANFSSTLAFARKISNRPESTDFVTDTGREGVTMDNGQDLVG